MSAIVSGDAARRLAQPQKLGSPAPLSAGRAIRLAQLVPTTAATAWASLLNDSDPINSGPYQRSRTPQGPTDPFIVPNVYSDPSGNEAAILRIRYDGVAALNFAIRYAIGGNPLDAQAAAAQIAPWTTISAFSAPGGSDTRLSWSYTFPYFIAAAMLIRDSAAWTTPLETAMADVITRSIGPLSTAYTNPSNQGVWGVVFEMAAASFLVDRPRFERAVRQWRNLFRTYVVNNIPIDEVYRQGAGQGDGRTGLFYSNFLGCAFTFAAEWARFNGVWLYDYVAPDGSSLKGLYENLAGWTRNPATFTYNTSGTVNTITEVQGHYRILNQLWPNADAAWLLANKNTVDRYGFRYVTLTHGQLPLIG